MKNSVLVCVSVVLFLSSNCVLARTLEIRTMSYPPYQYLENDRSKGIAIEIVEEAFRRIDQPINIIFLPWARALHEMKQGQSDGLFTVIKNPEREVFLDYTKEALMYQAVSLYVTKDSPIRFSGDLQSMSNYRFGVVRKFNYGSVWRAALKNNTITNMSLAGTQEMNIKKLIAGNRFDIMISDRLPALFLLKKLEVNGKVKELTPPVEEPPVYFAFSKKRKLTLIRDKFDLAIANMKKEGVYDEIFTRFLDEIK